MIPVKEVMTRNVITVNESMPLNEIAELLERHHIKRVPVLSDGRLGVGAHHQPPWVRPAIDRRQQCLETCDEYGLVAFGVAVSQRLGRVREQDGAFAVEQRMEQFDPVGEARVDDRPGDVQPFGNRADGHLPHATLDSDRQSGVEHLWAASFWSQMCGSGPVLDSSYSHEGKCYTFEYSFANVPRIDYVQSLEE